MLVHYFVREGEGCFSAVVFFNLESLDGLQRVHDSGEKEKKNFCTYIITKTLGGVKLIPYYK